MSYQAKFRLFKLAEVISYQEARLGMSYKAKFRLFKLGEGL